MQREGSACANPTMTDRTTRTREVPSMTLTHVAPPSFCTAFALDESNSPASSVLTTLSATWMESAGGRCVPFEFSDSKSPPAVFAGTEPGLNAVA
eukprot:1535947-Rhodomonas_salina.1